MIDNFDNEDDEKLGLRDNEVTKRGKGRVVSLLRITCELIVTRIKSHDEQKKPLLRTTEA